MTHELITAIIVAALGSQALYAIVQFLIEKLKKPSKLEIGIRLILQDKIKETATAALVRGETTPSERTYVVNCHEAYKALKGDGEMKLLLMDYFNLKVNYEKE